MIMKRYVGWTEGNHGPVERTLEIDRPSACPGRVLVMILSTRLVSLGALWLPESEAQRAGIELVRPLRDDLRMIVPRVALQDMTAEEITALSRLRKFAEG